MTFFLAAMSSAFCAICGISWEKLPSLFHDEVHVNGLSFSAACI